MARAGEPAGSRGIGGGGAVRTGGTEAVRLRAGVLLRARWRSAVVLGLLAGLAAGAVIGLVSIGRDTSTAVDRYERAIDEPDYSVTICPPGTDAEAAAAGACFTHDPVEELAALRADPAVRAAVRVSPTPVAIRPPGDQWQPSFAWVAHDPADLFERPPLVAGRASDPTRADEVMVSESLARLFGLAPGTRLGLAPLSPDDVDASAVLAAPSLPAAEVEVTGVLRLGSDIVTPQTDGSLATIESVIFLGAAWADAAAPTGYARYQTGIALWVDDGADVDAILDRAAPGQIHVADGGLTMDAAAGARETIDYQVRAAYAAAGLLGLAAVVLIGQVLARQARRELDDAEALRALGMTRGALGASAVPRWLLTAGVAAVVAVATALVVRPFGPVGIARRVADAGAGLDLGVAAAGLIALVVLVVGVGVLATARGAGGRSWRDSSGRGPAGRGLTVAASGRLPAQAAMGLALTAETGGRRPWRVAGPAVLGTALAVAAVVAVPTLRSSLDRLTAEPLRYGVGWDAVATGVLGPASSEWLAGQLRDVDGVAAVAGMRGASGAVIAGHQLYVYAFDPVPGLPTGIVPAITAGRAPAAADEIALGSQTLSDAGVDIGDTVALSYLDQTHDLRVVGEVIINDNYEVDPGRGGVVTSEWMTAADPATYASDYVVRFQDGHRDAGLAELKERFPGLVSPPLVQDDVVNLRRLDSWPAVLAGLTALMATAAFVHVLVTSVRAQRKQLAVAKALGWSRGQVGGSIFWYASFLALPAILIGVPAGVVLGRWGWGVVARSLGVPSVPVVPLVALGLVVVVALIVANALAVWPSWRAAHIRPGEALRAE